MFNFYVWKHELFCDYHKMAHIWQGHKYLTRFSKFVLFKPIQLVLCKRLTLSAASIFVTEGLFI